MGELKLFRLLRDVDETGVSGTGHVADGVVFWSGKCAVSWRTEHTSVAIYDDIETVERIHGHGGQTRVVFDGEALEASGVTTTARGFGLFEFVDANGEGCSLQKSSALEDDFIWLGVDDADPQKFIPHGGGWSKLELPPLPKGGRYMFTTRMHLTRDQVRELLPLLTYFANHGDLPIQQQRDQEGE